MLITHQVPFALYIPLLGTFCCCMWSGWKQLQLTTTHTIMQSLHDQWVAG